MTPPVPPRVECDRQHPSLAVTDVAAAVEFYTRRLGFSLDFTWGEPATMAGVSLDRVQVFLERGTPAPEGCSLYFVVGDADELHAFHEAAGVEVVAPPGDREYELRDYAVRDLHGHHLSFGHTRRQLAHIQALKRTHGIDYDSHASYRFVER